MGQLLIRGRSIPRDLSLVYQKLRSRRHHFIFCNTADVAAQVCDFSKSMMAVPSAAGSQIVCVLSPQA